MYALLTAALALVPTFVVGEASFTYGAAGTLAGIVAAALLQAWRGRSQQRVESATVEEIRANTGRIFDERWKSIAERVDAENEQLRADVRELRAEIANCRVRIADLEAQLASA